MAGDPLVPLVPLVSMHDHDLLIQLHTKMDSVAKNLDIIKELEYRVRVVEKEAGERSERVKAIRMDVDSLQRSQVNSGRIDALSDEVKELKKKGYIFDGLNAVGAVIAIIVAWLKS